jgi:uncharacterized protein YbjT (DUF2867 family)
MILVTGGTGFVGAAIVQEITRIGHPARVLARRTDSARAQALHRATGCQLVAGSVNDPTSLTMAMKGVETVVHLVGIIFEKGAQTFFRVHAVGTRNVVVACQMSGVTRLIHMSASGTREHAVAPYHRTKWEGECAVRQSALDWTIFRPAIIYGPGNGFCSILVRQMTPPVRWITGGVMPMIGDGTVLMQPVHVDEVAAAFVRSLTAPASIGQTYELGGPPISYQQLLVDLAASQKVRIHPLAIPREFAYAGAGIIEVLSPWKIPTPGHVAMLEEDQQADTSPARRDLGFHPLPFAKGLMELRTGE